MGHQENLMLVNVWKGNSQQFLLGHPVLDSTVGQPVPDCTVGQPVPDSIVG